MKRTRFRTLGWRHVTFNRTGWSSFFANFNFNFSLSLPVKKYVLNSSIFRILFTAKKLYKLFGTWLARLIFFHPQLPSQFPKCNPDRQLNINVDRSGMSSHNTYVLSTWMSTHPSSAKYHASLFYSVNEDGRHSQIQKAKKNWLGLQDSIFIEDNAKNWLLHKSSHFKRH